ncbi:MAG: enoyl-CoA hydratase-related protein [Acidimicrobiales bacterium]|nr:enoyl-CoA hydratase-related protein [Acidimicrobiales bacterium]MDG1877507.1 enoyl-CoA hydratase-related protein [Acidimicrobiales bacterium]
MTELPWLNVEVHDSHTVLTLCREDAMNALTPPMVAELDVALRDAAARRSCRAIMLTAVGRGFCVGIDVKEVAVRDAGTRAGGIDPLLAGFENLHHRLSAVIRTIHSLPIPVIAAVNGHAIGLGFAIAAACDLRVAGPSATFADGFVKRGISGCELGLSYFLPRIVGPAVAHELMLTGRRVRADEALAIGLVSSVTDDVDGAANELVSALAENAPAAVSMTKEVMWANLHASNLDQALALEARTQSLLRATLDAQEARKAFLEKRAPQFGNPPTKRPLR